MTFAEIEALEALGRNIDIAIRRRRFRRNDLAERAGISVPTLRAMVRGEPGVRIGAYVLVLGVLGLIDHLPRLAAPQEDKVGLAMEVRHLPKRVRIKPSEYDF